MDSNVFELLNYFDVAKDRDIQVLVIQITGSCAHTAAVIQDGIFSQALQDYATLSPESKVKVCLTASHFVSPGYRQNWLPNLNMNIPETLLKTVDFSERRVVTQTILFISNATRGRQDLLNWILPVKSLETMSLYT